MKWAVEQGISDGTDAETAGGYALDALRWAVEQGVITGKGGGILAPEGEATRAQVAAILIAGVRMGSGERNRRERE